MKILVVDDSKAMRMIVIRTLKKAGFDGHTILEASDGAEALKVVDESAPDVILSDWNMPNMDGITLLKTLREGGNQVTFGFVTTESTDDARQLAMESGAAFVICKPFTVERFEAQLNEVLAW